LVITSDREEPSIKTSSSELNSNDVLRVTSETSWHNTLSGGVSEKLDETVVITTRDKSLGFIHINSIDVSSISSLGENSINEPSELAVLRAPFSTGGV
jgi:hypothetical protein